MITLREALERVPDPRQRQGRRHPLGAILALAVCAMLSGGRSLYGISQWGRDQGAPIARALGFTRERTPSVATLHRVFRDLDRDAFEGVLGRWLQEQGLKLEEAIAIDGKSLRGIHGEALPGVHLVAAYAHRSGLVVGQKAVEAGGNELTALPGLLEGLVLKGQVVTGDAQFTQRELCQEIVEKGGGYLFTVKENQRTLKEELEAIWALEPDACPAATAVSKHGGRVEVRRLWVSDALVGYSDWPFLAQGCRLERVVRHKGKTRREVAYAATSLSKADAGPKRLLELWRGHWGIENRLHWVRDVTFHEDRCQVRSRAAPQVMAALRNLTISLLRFAGARNIAAALRRCAGKPYEALALIGVLPP